MGLTKGDKKVLEFIKGYMLENNITPTIRDICNGLGYYSTSSAHAHVKRLVDLGYIEMCDRRYKVKGVRYVEDAEN